MTDFTIAGNRITGSNLYAITVAGGERIAMRDNTIITDADTAPSPIYEKDVRGQTIRELTPSPVYLQNIHDMSIDNLKVEDMREDLGAALLTGPDVANLKVGSLQLKLAPGVPATGDADKH